MSNYYKLPLAVLFLAVLLGFITFIIKILLRYKDNLEEDGVNTIARCLSGHLFTTIWIPFISFKALRLAIFRIQRCPIGNHLTFVSPVNKSALSDEERRFASIHHDSRIT